MVLSVPAYQSGPGSFRIESAFAQHLRTLKAKLGDLAATIVIAGPQLDDRAQDDPTLHTLSQSEGFEFVPLFPANTGRLAFLLNLPALLRKLRALVRNADIVHAGPSTLYRMFEWPALVMAHRLGKRTIYVTDIDNRESPKMLYRSGAWGWRQYVAGRWIHGTAMHLQHRYAAARFSLVLLKGATLVADYGAGRPNVRNFLDAAFEETHLVPALRLQAKLPGVRCDKTPLKLVYFGRLVAYKGVDHMLRALAVALEQGANVEFEIIGDGPQRAQLEVLAASLQLSDHVRFSGAVAFGDALFERLRDAHVLLAAPLSEDTPRSALDALASGQVILAYSTYYYREMRAAGAPVTVVPWFDHAAMGRAIVDLDRDRASIAGAMTSARAFAESNTQQAWLDRRVQWTRELVPA